jgi:hypothetical protein
VHACGGNLFPVATDVVQITEQNKRLGKTQVRSAVPVMLCDVKNVTFALRFEGVACDGISPSLFIV